MQVTTSSAFVAATIAAVIGFGIALGLALAINRQPPSRLRGSIVHFAMVLLGVGLTWILAEILVALLHGLPPRKPTEFVGVVANVLLAPAILLIVSRLVGDRIDRPTPRGNTPATSRGQYAMYAILATITAAILMVAFKSPSAGGLSELPPALEVGEVSRRSSNVPPGASAEATYDFYPSLDTTDCGAHLSTPSTSVSFRFVHDEEKNRIIAFSEIREKGVKTHSVRELYPCVIVNLENWSCGGDTTLIGARVWRKHTYTLTDGQLTIEKAGFEGTPRTCPDRIVKR